MTTPLSPSEKIGIGIIGGSGYIGAELLRYAAVHPAVEIRWVTAHSQVGQEISSVLPNLMGCVRGRFVGLDEGEERLGEVGAVFVSLPHNESQKVIPRLCGKAPEAVFIDMAGDFRTDDPEGYKKFYGCEHAAQEWISRFVYGFPEFNRERIRGARLIANPGCFATGLNLGLAPLAAVGKLRGAVFAVGVTGSSGSGNKPSATTHHPERANNFRSYKVLSHQHVLEVEAFLRTLTEEPFRLDFVPQSGPFVRGIFVTIYTPGVGREELESIFRGRYDGEELVSVVRGSPELRWVQGSPRSVVGVDGKADVGVVFTVTDNLTKGAASQAFQNLNLALGLPETTGLGLPGGFV
jgi:N-acetyl-gamma-glutamyl-phosphate reductase